MAEEVAAGCASSEPHSHIFTSGENTRAYHFNKRGRGYVKKHCVIWNTTSRIVNFVYHTIFFRRRSGFNQGTECLDLAGDLGAKYGDKKYRFLCYFRSSLRIGPHLIFFVFFFIWSSTIFDYGGDKSAEVGNGIRVVYCQASRVACTRWFCLLAHPGWHFPEFHDAQLAWVGCFEPFCTYSYNLF